MSLTFKGPVILVNKRIYMLWKRKPVFSVRVRVVVVSESWKDSHIKV